MDASPAASPRAARPVVRALLAVAIALIVAMWVYVLYLAFGPGRATSPDRLADPTFATAAEARCDAALDEIAQLPPASQAVDAAARAETLVIANAALAEMLQDLRTYVPAGDDGELVSEWLDDWGVYLADRESYAERLLTEPKARLLVSPKGGRQVTTYLDQFAKDNTMPACSTPADAA